MACRSAWLSGRTDPLGRSSSSKGQGRELAIGVLLSGGASRRPAPGLAGHAAGEVAAGWCARWSAGVSRVRSAARCLAWTRSMAVRARCRSARWAGSWGSGPRARSGSVIW